MKTNLFERITRYFAPPTRILAMLLASVVAYNVWAEVPTPVVVWDGDFSSLSKTVGDVTYTIGNVTGSGVSTASANSVGGDKSYLQIANSDSGVAAPIVTASGGVAPFGSSDGSTVLIFVSNMPTSASSNRALLSFMDNSGDCYGKTSSGTPENAWVRFGIARPSGYGYGGTNAGGFIIDGYIRSTDNINNNAFTNGKQSIALTYKGPQGSLKYYVDGQFKGEYNPGSSFTTPTGICIGGVDYTSSSWFYAQKSMKIHTIAIFNKELSAEEVAEYEAQSKWRYCDAIAWRNTSGDFHAATFAPVSSVSATASTSYTRTYATSEFPWATSFREESGVNCPAALFYDVADKQQSVQSNFDYLRLNGLFVNATTASGIYTLTAGTAGRRETYLGDTTGNHESWFVFNESYIISRGGASDTKMSKLYGTVNMQIADSKTFSFNATATTAASNIVMTAGSSNTDAPRLNMIGSGQFVIKHLNASTGKLDYSALDPSGQSTTPFINGLLTVSDSTTYAFPALSGAATFRVAKELSADATRTTTFAIGGNEYSSPLTFTASTGMVAFPAVATLDSDKAWSAISWDAKPTTIDNTTVATLNITGNTTLDIDAATSLDKLVLNISNGITLTLTTPGNLTLTSGLVLRGTGTLKINGAVTTPAFDVEDSATILFSGDSAAITVTGTATVASGKTLYIAADNWTTPALAGTRDVITATTLTNNGTVSIGAVTGDEGRTYTVSISGTAVSVMRMTSEAFAYNTYPGGGDATGWATSWGGEEFDANQLRVGPSETYKYAYYTTSDKHPYQGSLTDRGDSLSLSVYADLSQTPSSGKAVIVGFGGAGTANNKLLMLYREESTVKWAVVDRGPDDGTTAVLGSAASVTLPSGGYHLYTGTFDKTTGNLQLFLDGAAAVNGTSAANTTIASGMQIGNAFEGVAQFKGSHGFVMGTNAAIVAMRGYNVVLDSAEVGVLAGRYPASTGAIDMNIQLDLSGKTLTVYGSTESTATTMGPGEGTMVIAADNTVKVTNFRTYPYENLTGGATAATIAGKLEVTAEDNDSIAAEKGVVLGYYLSASSGARTTAATVPSGGEIDAAKAYVMMPWSAQVASATLNISGGTVKVKGLMSNQANKGTVNLTDGGVLEVGEILATGQAIVKNFGYGTFRVKANAEETRTVNFTADAETPTTLDPNGHALTMSAAAMTGSGAVKVGGSNGGTVTFSGFTSAFTGTIIIDDSNKDMVSVTSWDNFKGTLNYGVTSGTLDLSSYTLDDAATINITGSGAAVTLKTGPTVNVSSGATVKLKVTEDVYKYEGFLYRGASDGTVQYYQGETPTLVTSEYMNGNNLLPYYSIFQGHAADGDNYVGNLNTASDWKNGTDDGFAVPTSRNAAIYVPDGKTLTVTIDNTCSFGEVQIYTDPTATTGGTVIFKKGESGSMTVTSVMCVTDNTAMQIDDEGVVFSGSEINLASGATAIFNATSYSVPKITGSGNIAVNEDKAVTFADSANAVSVNVSGAATISSGKTLTATTLNVAGKGVVNVPDSNSSLSVTTATGTGTINWVGKKPDGTVWTANGWSGTNVVSSAEAEGIPSLDPENWGRNGSYIVMKNLKGYIDTNGGTINAEVIFEDGTQGYALNISNGYNGRNTYFRKISGSGTIKDGELSTGAVQQFIFQDANEFTGSITPAGDNASDSYYTKRFVFASSGYDTDGYGTYFGTLRVLSNGAAKVGAGKTWKANTGISIAGTVTFCGGAAAAKMASPTTFTDGATLVFQDGAGLSFEAASSPVTLPASGTVNIDASAMTLTSSGATILTSTVDFTADDVAKLKSVGRHVFALDGTDAKKINVYPAVAKVGDTYYTDLATAEAAVSESSPFIEVYDGTPAGTYNTFSTGEGVATYRKTNLNVYYRSGIYWSSNTEGLFELADGTATPAYAGDTIVIDSKSTGDIWADPANPVVATAISVERGVTFKQGEGTGNLFDGKTFTVADGVTLTISGPTRAVTLGAVTFNKATSTGAVTLDGSTNGITLNGNLSGTAPITVARTVVATGRNIANTLKGAGTIVYDGTLPTVAPTFDSSWGGTVWLKNFTSMTNAMMTMDKFCNSSSMVKVTNVAGYIYQHPEITGTLYLEDNGDQKALTINNGWNKDGITVAKLMGTGSLVLGKAATPESTTGTSSPAFTFTAKDVSVFQGNVEVTNMRFVAGDGFSDTTPLFDTTRNAAAASEVGIVITSGTSATIAANKTWKAGGLFKWNDGKEWAYCGTVRVCGDLTVNGSLTANAGASGSDNKGKIEVASDASMTIGPDGLVTAVEEIAVNGTMSTTGKERWSGTINVGDTGVLELTSTAYVNETDKDYSSITGTGTLKYSGTGHRTLPFKAGSPSLYPAETLTIEDEQSDALVVHTSNLTIGSFSGTKNLRSDWSGSSSSSQTHSLIIKQSKNTTWSGVFQNEDRLASVTVNPGEDVTGTLTIAGDQIAANESYTTESHKQNNGLIVNGSVNLTGSWVGPATVTGTFGGIGTVSSVTFDNGSIFKVFVPSGYGAGTSYLKAPGGVTVEDGEVVWVETLQAPDDGMVLMDWTGSDEAPAGTFRFANETYRRGYDINVSGKQLVVSAKTAIVLDVAADTTTEVDEDYYYCNIRKTSEGTAKLTGSLEGVNLTISAGTVELAGATIVDSSLFGTGKLMISAGTDLRGLTFDSTFSGTVEIKMGVMVTVTESQKDYILYGHESDYTATQNKDGSWTLEHALPDTVISFASNDPNVAVKVPEDADGVEYVYSHGKIDGVKIGSKPIRLDNFTGMNRVTPFTLSLDVTIPETIDYSGYAEGFGPVLFSFNVGANEIYVMRKSDGVMAARFYPLNNADSTTDYAAVSGQKVATKALELGNTYHIELRYWGIVIDRDNGDYPYARGLSSQQTGTSVFVDGIEDWHHNGLRWGTSMTRNSAGNGYTINGKDFSTTTYGTAAATEEAADAEMHKNCVFPTNIVIGAATKATLTGERIFDGLVVHAAGFLNLAGFQNKVGTEAVRAALPGMTSSDAAATYWYDYGVTASGVSGGYALGEQTRYGVAGANNDSRYSRGVIMSHTKSGDGKFTIALGISIPAGSAGGTVCEIPMSSGSITVTYDGSTDMFSLNGTAQTTAAGDGAHVLVLTYDTTYGAYLWVDTYDESGDRSNPTISDPSCIEMTLGDVIYFGSGASDSAANNFFANLGVAYQNVQFGVAVCDESDVEQAIEAFDFGVELAKMPLSEKLKYLVNVSHDGGTVPVPTITIGTGAGAKVLSGYAALSAARTLGAYTDAQTTLGVSSFDSSSCSFGCAIDNAYAGQLFVSLVGSTNNLTWKHVASANIPSASDSVTLSASGQMYGSGNDYRWLKIIEQPYIYGDNTLPAAGTLVHEMLAKTPVEDKIFKYGQITGNQSQCYRIPAIASTWGVADDPANAATAKVMGIFDARYCYQDLGVPVNSDGTTGNADNYANPDHYTGIDIAGCFSLDGGDNWSYPQVMIDVPNSSDPQTGVKTKPLTKLMELGDPCIVYDAVNQKFIMMGITGGGLTTVSNGRSDVVTYECSLSSVQNGNPDWTSRTPVKSEIEAALVSAIGGGYTIPGPKTIYYGNGYQGILQCPGSALVLRKAWNGLDAGTIVWPMQYCYVDGTGKGGLFVAWKSGGDWHATKPIPNDGETTGEVVNNYLTQEGALEQLDDGNLYFMAKDAKNTNGSIDRPFYKYDATSGEWVYATKIDKSIKVQGSMIRIGEADGVSRYAAVFCTGDDTSPETFVRKNLRLFVGTDSSMSETPAEAAKGVIWNETPYADIWLGETGSGSSRCFGYSSLVMLNPTTLGVLFEANGHIYFTKVDVAGALQ